MDDQILSHMRIAVYFQDIVNNLNGKNCIVAARLAPRYLQVKRFLGEHLITPNENYLRVRRFNAELFSPKTGRISAIFIY